MKKQRIRINESQLAKIVKESVKKVLKEDDSVSGKYLRYSPEQQGFDSKDGWTLNQNFDTEQFKTLINNSLNELNKARDYARKNGAGEWYMLLNAIMGEVYDKINEQ